MSSIITTGTFTSSAVAGTPVNVSVPSGITEFSMINITDIGSAAPATPVMKAYWNSLMPADSAIYALKTNGAATIAIDTMIIAGGFSLYDQGNLALIATTPITSITQAAAAVVTSVAHGMQTGDICIFANLNAMTQLNGMTFQITRTGADTFTIPINTAGFGAPAVAGGTVRRLAGNELFAPRKKYIVGMTAANPMVVSTSEPHGYSIGSYVRIQVPFLAGTANMYQANNILAQITAVGTPLTFTLGAVNSAAFTAFAFPATAVGLRYTQPFVTAVGEIPTILTDAEDNTGIRGMRIGGAVLADATKQWFWTAKKAM